MIFACRKGTIEGASPSDLRKIEFGDDIDDIHLKRRYDEVIAIPDFKEELMDCYEIVNGNVEVSLDKLKEKAKKKHKITFEEYIEAVMNGTDKNFIKTKKDKKTEIDAMNKEQLINFLATS